MMPFSFGSVCNHEHPTEITTISNISIFLSDEDGVFHAEELGQKVVVLNLLGQSHYGQMPAELEAFSMFGFEEIVVKWPDGGFPAVNSGFWPGILDYAIKSKFDAILIHCKAGHGRTGTAIAALLIACKQMTPKEAIEFVRKNYCTETIETQVQINYLGWIAENFAIENDSAKVRPSYEIKFNPPKQEPAEEVPVNYDWDEFI